MIHECVDCQSEVTESGDTKRVPRKCVDQAGPKRCVTHTGKFVRQQRAKRHASHVERTYGISGEDAHELLLLQGGRCWLCQRATGATKALAVDHDHGTGEVRGRLCGPCNQFIGRLSDDPATAQRLVSYLSGDTPYRRLKAAQTLAAAMPVYPQGIRVFRVWALGDELFADWRFEDEEAFSQWLVRRADGVWAAQPHSAVADTEPRVETSGECSSCHALPDQPHTEYCNRPDAKHRDPMRGL